ncbi:CLAVATA3/ESR (CLE)-related protein 16 [Raphanus sativus]|uniref:CLAVATA3/ESR (CLE)-related protein 16-like n=1 Tax=Raphanus sativus TaxID=3726 RepID=A0A6J0N4Q5_RAPSA|nr:CLAVATA3/ESR (CLE)-related protein 16-like [Raphanus sativus]KAJ4901327.1 CLAVATA3/ESR (CLE)-related protein 16 [Raphanus sativus]
MEDFVRKERDKRRRRRKRAAVSTMFLWGTLFFAQFCLSSSSALSPDQYNHQSFPSPRKAGPFHKTASFQSPRASVSFMSPRREEENIDDVYNDDKRLVHTGPNPLHN